jgi:hypothetical protein
MSYKQDNPTTSGQRVGKLEMILAREMARRAMQQTPRSDLLATVRKAERWVLGIAAIVVIMWVVAHLAAVFVAVALLATGKRMLHL